MTQTVQYVTLKIGYIKTNIYKLILDIWFSWLSRQLFINVFFWIFLNAEVELS